VPHSVSRLPRYRTVYQTSLAHPAAPVPQCKATSLACPAAPVPCCHISKVTSLAFLAAPVPQCKGHLTHSPGFPSATLQSTNHSLTWIPQYHISKSPWLRQMTSSERSFRLLRSTARHMPPHHGHPNAISVSMSARSAQHAAGKASAATARLAIVQLVPHVLRTWRTRKARSRGEPGLSAHRCSTQHKLV